VGSRSGPGLSSLRDLPDLPLSTLRDLMRRHGIRPSKRLGQHFLVDAGALRSVVAAAELDPQDNVLEIGPGLGTLTRCLASASRAVVAVELDPRLLPPLREVLGDAPHVRLVQGDILRQDLAALLGPGPYKVVANIPYNITSILIRRLMEADHRPTRIVLTVQREVAERIIVGPGEMSLLALSVAVYGRPKIAARIPPEAFYPPPEVDSAVLRIEVTPPRLDAALIEPVFRLAQAGFSQRRKQLRNALAAGLRVAPGQVDVWLERAGLPARARAQELAIEDWERLARAAGPAVG
jgi:16S rRNA (adenine1518-N6/adenine1519-N6)-dimethyltransferase